MSSATRSLETSATTALSESFAEAVAQDAEKLGARHDHQPIELLLTVCLRKTAGNLAREIAAFRSS